MTGPAVPGGRGRPGSLAWFAGHELRLAWRDWLSMMTAGRRRRERTLVVALGLVALLMHLLAYGMVGRFAAASGTPDKGVLVVVTGAAMLSWTLMLSQAMESVTRAFYARSDLDLILSSPASVRRLFALRIGAIAATTTVMALLLAAPFVNVLAFAGDPRWLAAYGVVVALGAAAAALAVTMTVVLFRAIGPRRTRLIAQIVAAIVGAAFVIGIQVAAILSYGSFSRLTLFRSDALVVRAPDADSVLWWPARAAMGDLALLAVVLAAALAVLAAVIVVFSKRFGEHVVAAAGVAHSARGRTSRAAFRVASPRAALRRKELVLLKRDPWLLSQTLMQVLYLLPPALLLWQTYGEDTGGLTMLVPVVVMASGQLAGGLAWLAISGEDAPDLVASAPVAASAVIRAKVEAVLSATGLVLAPLLAALAFAAPFVALVTLAGTGAAAGSAIMVQLWFRAQAKRSLFRRRQVSSRTATFAEAFSSIAWAATAGMAAAATWFALAGAAMALAVLAVAYRISPDRDAEGPRARRFAARASSRDGAGASPGRPACASAPRGR